MTANARLELRIAAESKALIERAAELTNRSVTALATEVLVAYARGVVEGPGRHDQPRPIGGWSFALPEGWDAPLDELAEYR